MTIKFERVVPIFRIFSLEKAREFYIDFLGCKIDWEYRAPSQMLPFTCRSLVSGFTVHLIEHHGDGTPGSVAYVYTTGIAALHRELNDRKYRHNRPALEQMDWGMMQMTVIDPFGNRLCFGEPVEKRETLSAAVVSLKRLAFLDFSNGIRGRASPRLPISDDTGIPRRITTALRSRRLGSRPRRQSRGPVLAGKRSAQH